MSWGRATARRFLTGDALSRDMQICGAGRHDGDGVGGVDTNSETPGCRLYIRGKQGMLRLSGWDSEWMARNL